MSAFRRFTAPKVLKQFKGMQPCCRKLKNWYKWDCGCSWGCELCWASWTCAKCHKKFSNTAGRVMEIVKNETLP